MEASIKLKTFLQPKLRPIDAPLSKSSLWRGSRQCPACQRRIARTVWKKHKNLCNARKLRKKRALEKQKIAEQRRKQANKKYKLVYGPEWTETLKKAIRQRDNFECQWCGKTQQENGAKLSVHHIDKNPLNCAPINLVSLCKHCHEFEAHEGIHCRIRKSG